MQASARRPAAFVPSANVRPPTAIARLPSAAGKAPSPPLPANDPPKVRQRQQRLEQAGAPVDVTEEQERFLGALRRGKSVFLTGRAGTGKTFTLRRGMRELANDNLFVTASTNIAATNLGGSAITFAKFAGIGIGDRPLEEILATMSQETRANIERCEVLFLDELSMVAASTVELADDVCRKVRGIDLPFGGIQRIFSGDMAQLQPPDSDSKERREKEAAGLDTSAIPRKLLAFRSKRWREWVDEEILLTKIFRQTYAPLTAMLEEVRTGQVSPGTVARLTALDRPTKGVGDSVYLAVRNTIVDDYNDKCLAALEGEVHTFDAKEYVTNHGNREHVNKVYEAFCAKCPGRLKLRLKKGARVICTANVHGLVNGLRGIVVGFHVDQEGVRVKFDNLPLPVFVFPYQWSELDRERLDRNGRPYTICSRKALPLRLAYAMTIHKAQGMGFEEMTVDLQGVFDYAMVYVALSRYKTPAPDASGSDPMRGLRIKNFDVRAVVSNPIVEQFHADLERRAHRAAAKRAAGEHEENTKRQRAEESGAKEDVAEESGEESDLDMFPNPRVR